MSPKLAGESATAEATTHDAAVDVDAGQAGGSTRRRGRRPGTQGVSHHNIPEFVKAFLAKMCGNRTDRPPFDETCKTVVDNTKCNEQVCHTEKATSGLCVGCGAVTEPDTDTIPGAACGPRLRRIIANMYEVISSVGGIRICRSQTTIAACPSEPYPTACPHWRGMPGRETNPAYLNSMPWRRAAIHPCRTTATPGIRVWSGSTPRRSWRSWRRRPAWRRSWSLTSRTPTWRADMPGHWCSRQGNTHQAGPLQADRKPPLSHGA